MSAFNMHDTKYLLCVLQDPDYRERRTDSPASRAAVQAVVGSLHMIIADLNL